MNNPIATYRIQFHKEFTLADFERIIPYLQRLGVSTIYASPVFEATPGSTHGYDTLDTHKINPEIGTEDQLIDICRRLKSQGIKWVQDIVPNHMAYDPRNPWIMYLLERGPRSAYAKYFDVNWQSPVHEGKLMVPFLGSDLDSVINNNELKLAVDKGRLVLNYFETAYPVNFETYKQVLGKIDHEDVEKLLEKLKDLPGDDDEKFREKSLKIVQRFERLLTKRKAAAVIQQAIEDVNNNKEQLRQLANDQHYHLCSWQETDKQINFRRFFTVNGLICLNIQDPDVFGNHHSLIRSMVEQRIWQGLRVDHIDGLYDPTAYLQQLRQLAGKDTYIVVEKILEPGESLPEYWEIEGTSGYEFLSLVNNLFTNKKAEQVFTNYYKGLVNDDRSIHQQIHDKKAYILYENMAGELDNLYHLLISLDIAGELPGEEVMKKAIGEFLIQCPVYRYYGNLFPLVGEEADAVADILKRVRESKPETAAGVDVLEKVFLGEPANGDDDYKARAAKFYQRCMQFTGPLMAKGVEDTLMYTYNRFIGHNEVGDSPEAFGMSIEEFHQAMQERQRLWPLAMNGTSTHDTKRGEDVRARLNVLTEMGEEWISVVEEWRKINAENKKQHAPDDNDEYLVYQNIVGAYPMPGQDEDNFAERIQEYLQKALREAKIHSNWTTPNEEYETATKEFAVSLLNQQGSFWQSFQQLQQKIVDFGIINSLAQTVLKFTCPGIPDVYQGTELWDLSLVDPDNRRPVDYTKRQQWLEQIDNAEDVNTLLHTLWDERYSGGIKLWLESTLFSERKRRSQVFAKGAYVPLQVEGKYKDHVMAFARQHNNTVYVIAVPVHLYTICNEQQVTWQELNWEDTAIVLPEGIPSELHDVLLDISGKPSDTLQVQDLFHRFPVSILRFEKVNERGAGILLHISSLPSPFAIGDLGPEAKYFADFLVRSHQKYWQLLPLNPTEQGQGHSPYSALSASAGNPLLISPELLVKDGLLQAYDLQQYMQPQEGKTNYAAAESVKAELLELAYQNYREQKPTQLQRAFDDFCHTEITWLDDYALYMVLKKHHEGKPWFQWEEKYKLREEAALQEIMNLEYYEYSKIKWLQFIFFRQWKQLKKYCNKRGIKFIGDMPFYVSYDSSDVWSHRHLFSIDEDGQLTGVAGVPPDDFSEDGQLWGMPLFKWEAHKETGYEWWIQRLRKNVEMCDIVRLDHFRAFADYWDVPASETTARNGEWKKGPGSDFFNAVKKAFGELPFVAEDLGDINADVLNLRDEFNLPGMKILQFAFSDNMPQSDYIPHNYGENFIAYTGTHDNNTIRGWYRELDEESKTRLNQYTGRDLHEDDIPWVMARLAYASVARIAILPLQDLLGLDEIARMNMPGQASDNWAWRLLPGQVNEQAQHQLQEWTWLFNRE
ncbi:malto-oligosyltrehalose synthase [Aridibaculum aurantiacum]|uniref:malto-oligosyltrehalose synthase n=1 Tax=Aridibaculum aurantiacum TaxID=2810307 RepID=UPI001A97214A|nr:malto-oligosyltrehalose synthase [Aridibaculum aurantiacum]